MLALGVLDAAMSRLTARMSTLIDRGVLVEPRIEKLSFPVLSEHCS